jgi:hypothetical protein
LTNFFGIFFTESEIVPNPVTLVALDGAAGKTKLFKLTKIERKLWTLSSLALAPDVLPAYPKSNLSTKTNLANASASRTEDPGSTPASVQGFLERHSNSLVYNRLNMRCLCFERVK